MNGYTKSSQITKPGVIRVAGCSRCGGSGAFGPRVIFEGRCFECRGTGCQPNGVPQFAYPETWTDEQISAHEEIRAAKKIAAAERKAAKKAAAGDAIFAANVERFPALAEVGEGSWEVLRDIASKARKFELSEAQGALVTRSVAQDAAKAAAAALEAVAEPVEVVECPEGKLTLTGEVLTTKWQESQYGSTLKMLVECGGFKVWGTVPTAISPERGDLVRFNCTVERSSDDPSFGYFKRPTKAEIVSEVAV